MARLNLKNMKEKIKSKAPGGGGNGIWSPMGNMKQGDTAVVRLVPFEDEHTAGFWTAQKKISLKFVSPDNDDETWSVNVPCLEMYEDPALVKCPVANLTRDLFKQADELKKEGSTEEANAITDVALSHWIRYAYYFQGFMLKGGPDGSNPNELIPMLFPKSMYKGIHDSVFSEEDGSLETLPTGSFDMDDIAQLVAGEVPSDMSEEEFLELFIGRNYVVKKTEKGGYNNYESSTWEMKESELTDEQIAHIAENGLLDLSKYLPKRPSEEQYDVYEEMARVSIDFALGEGDGAWNPEWEEEYGIKPIKPRSSEGDSGGSSANGTGSSLKERMKNRNKAKADSDDEGDSSSAEETRAKLSKSRGAAKKPPAKEEAPAEEAAETSADEGGEESGGASDRVTAMRERLAAKKKKAAEAA